MGVGGWAGWAGPGRAVARAATVAGGGVRRGSSWWGAMTISLLALTVCCFSQ